MDELWKALDQLPNKDSIIKLGANLCNAILQTGVFFKYQKMALNLKLIEEDLQKNANHYIRARYTKSNSGQVIDLSDSSNHLHLQTVNYFYKFNIMS